MELHKVLGLKLEDMFLYLNVKGDQELATFKHCLQASLDYKTAVKKTGVEAGFVIAIGTFFGTDFLPVSAPASSDVLTKKRRQRGISDKEKEQGEVQKEDVEYLKRNDQLQGLPLLWCLSVGCYTHTKRRLYLLTCAELIRIDDIRKLEKNPDKNLRLAKCLNVLSVEDFRKQVCARWLCFRRAARPCIWVMMMVSRLCLADRGLGEVLGSGCRTHC